MNVQNAITGSRYIRRKDGQDALHRNFKKQKGQKKKKTTHVVTTLNLISVVNYGKCVY